MELDCDAVLMNTAIAAAKDPIRMARAMKHAEIAGREALSGGPHAEEALRRFLFTAWWADLGRSENRHHTLYEPKSRHRADRVRRDAPNVRRKPTQKRSRAECGEEDGENASKLARLDP